MKLFYLSILILLGSCAQINELTGGVDDEYAPAIDSAKSFPINGEVNYSGDLIRLRFDEYITLVKPNENILITPRPAIDPEFVAHNKTLEIIFREPLLENTTYTLNFNRAITDITEKNDSIFQYVFSTGNYIDSLSLRGQITDAYTNVGASDFVVALYPMTDQVQFDSVPLKLKPTYISQTDKSGNYKLNYLKYGVYYLFAFDDKNKNLKLDSDEDVAFLPERTILVNAENIRANLKSFKRENNSVELEKVTFSAPGKLELLFTNAPVDFSISSSMDLLQEDTESQDSLVFWLSANPTPKMRFSIYLNGEADTLKPVYKINNAPLKSLQITSNLKEGKLNPDEYLELTFSEPVGEMMPEKFRLVSADSVFTDADLELINLRTVVVKNKSEKQQTLFVDSAAVVSVFGNVNTQNVSFGFESWNRSYYGGLILNTDTVFSSPCLVYLVNSQGKNVDTLAFSSKMEFSDLIPGDYQLRLVFDEDGNGEWTTGSLTEGRIPEKVIYFNEVINVKSKWEKEVDWILKTTSNGS